MRGYVTQTTLDSIVRLVSSNSFFDLLCCFVLTAQFLNTEYICEYESFVLTVIDDCDTSPCQHGSCLDLVNDYACLCDPDYTGFNCETGKFKQLFRIPLLFCGMGRV